MLSKQPKEREWKNSVYNKNKNMFLFMFLLIICIYTKLNGEMHLQNVVEWIKI